MTPTRCAHAFIALAMLLLLTANPTTAQTKETDVSAVAATLLNFHAALAAGSTETAVSLLAPDAVVLENGYMETRHEYVEHHLLSDIKFARAVPSKRSKPTVTVDGDVAWASSTSVITGTYQSKTVKIVSAELMVFSRTTSGWEIRAIHWSSRKSR